MPTSPTTYLQRPQGRRHLTGEHEPALRLRMSKCLRGGPRQAYNEKPSVHGPRPRSACDRFIKEHGNHPKAQEAIVWWAGFATDEAMEHLLEGPGPQRRQGDEGRGTGRHPQVPGRGQAAAPGGRRASSSAQMEAVKGAKKGRQVAAGGAWKPSGRMPPSSRSSATITWPKPTTIPRIPSGGRRWKRPPRSSTTSSRPTATAKWACTPTCGREKRSWNWATTWSWPRTSSMRCWPTSRPAAASSSRRESGAMYARSRSFRSNWA